MGVLLTMYDGRNNAAKTIRNVAIGTFSKVGTESEGKVRHA